VIYKGDADHAQRLPSDSGEKASSEMPFGEKIAQGEEGVLASGEGGRKGHSGGRPYLLGLFPMVTLPFVHPGFEGKKLAAQWWSSRLGG
jgi:hypothetical protein